MLHDWNIRNLVPRSKVANCKEQSKENQADIMKSKILILRMVVK